MSAPFQLSEPLLRQVMRPYRLGDLVSLRPLVVGTAIGFYEVHTSRGRFYLRLYEDRPIADAHFEEALLLLLSRQQVAVPKMLPSGREGHLVCLSPRQQIVIYQPLLGREVGGFEVQTGHCAQIGTYLAQLHLAARGLKLRRRNRADPVTMRALIDRTRLAASAELIEEIDRLTDALSEQPWARELPRGIIHGDLSIASSRFRRHELTGILNFDAACNGPLVYDLAVTLLDWAFLRDRFSEPRAQALVQAYIAVRPLRARERSDLFGLTRYAAARVALARMALFEVRRRGGEDPRYRDYRHYMTRLAELHRLGAAGFATAVQPGAARLRQDH